MVRRRQALWRQVAPRQRNWTWGAQDGRTVEVKDPGAALRETLLLLFGPRQRQMVIARLGLLIGRPGSGKSTIACLLALAAVDREESPQCASDTLIYRTRTLEGLWDHVPVDSERLGVRVHHLVVLLEDARRDMSARGHAGQVAHEMSVQTTEMRHHLEELQADWPVGERWGCVTMLMDAQNSTSIGPIYRDMAVTVVYTSLPVRGSASARDLAAAAKGTTSHAWLSHVTARALKQLEVGRALVAAATHELYWLDARPLYRAYGRVQRADDWCIDLRDGPGVPR